MGIRNKYKNRPIEKYAFAILITLFASSLQYLLIYNAKIPVPGILYPATFLVAWYFGFGPACLAIFMGTLMANFFFYEPRFSLRWLQYEDGVRLSIFAFTSFFAAWIVARGREAEMGLVRSQSRLEESENLFRKVADDTPALLWRSRADGSFDWFNQAWVEFTGREMEDEVGEGWLAGVHPHDLERCGKIYRENFDARKKFSMEYRLKGKDGKFRWMFDQGAPRFSRQGEFLGFIGSCLDIHEQHEAVAALKNLKERFERSADATELGIWYCDLPFSDLAWNSKCKEHFFLPPEANVRIETFYDRIHPEDREAVKQAIESTLENRAPYDTEFRTVAPGEPDRIKWLRAIGWVDFDPHGEPIRFDGITLDNTTIRQIAGERDESLEKARQAIRVRDEFLSISSHELRTPLTPLKLQIQSLSKYLERGTLAQVSDERLKRMLEISEKQVNRLTALIDDLLDVSRISSGKLTLNFEAVDLAALVREVIERYQPHLQATGCEVELEMPAALPARVDQIRFEQIVINFLTNAMRYAAGKPIEISLEEKDGQAILKVRDRGIGISEEDQKRIFDRFERILSSSNYGGLGLGLFIVRQIVSAHGGSVWVESKPGVGSTFIVSLPLPQKR